MHVTHIRIHGWQKGGFTLGCYCALLLLLFSSRKTNTSHSGDYQPFEKGKAVTRAHQHLSILGEADDEFAVYDEEAVS